MAGHKSSLTSHKNSHKNVILWLLGLTICYQIAYQAFMYHEIQQEALDEVCHAPSMGGSFAGQSPHCEEVQLFRSWQDQEAEWHAALAAESGEEHLIKESAPVLHFGEIAADSPEPELQLPVQGNATGNSTGNATQDSAHGAIAAIAEATAAATAAAAARSTTAAPKVAPPAPGAFLAPANASAERAPAPADQSQEAEGVPMTAWAAGLEKLEHQLEEQMEHLPSMRHKHAHERQARMDSLMDSVAASLANTSKAEVMTPWATELVALQKHLDEELHAREEAHHAHHLHSTTATTTEVSLLDRIYRVGHELCATPDHRDRPECAQFMHGEHPETHGETDAKKLAHRAAKASWRMNLTQDIKEHEAQLDSKLAELRGEKKAWEEAFIARVASARSLERDAGAEATGIELTQSASSLRGGGRVYVHWSSVKAWHGPKWWEMSTGRSLVTREEAQGAHWAGMIPKVACITAITSGFHAKIQMKYFINNFHLQNYEGPRQLVFVYHHTDLEAAKLVQRYSDGVSIRGVAARNNESFPSTQGLRYGAWITDADVIARWDFEEWHHPNRLSLQVRALALSTRPACVVQQAAGTTHSLSREASIVGEAVWMRRHWRPMAANESEVLDSVQADRVVQLHADDLRHEGHGAATSRRPRACEGVAGAAPLAEASDPGLEDRIGAKVGAQMQEMYRGLAAKRRDAAQKLRSLCVEFSAEADAQRQERLSADAEKMSAVLSELDKHFAALGSLFGSSP